jgi:hypothetical protein
MGTKDKINMNERTEDYWLAVTNLASKYRKDPKIQKKERRDALLYWGVMLIFCLLIAPLFLLFFIWFNLGESFSFFDFLFSQAAKAIWITISTIGGVLSIMFIPKPEKHSWNMAINELDDNSVPYQHREF